MSRRTRSEPVSRRASRSWLWTLGFALLFVLSATSLIRRSEQAPATAGPGQEEDPEEEYRRERNSYIIGLCLAFALTGVPFAMVYWSAFGRFGLMVAIGIFAFFQAIVHFRFFLHINPPKQNVDDLHLILFSTGILALMAGGTIWILYNLAVRMMF
jgi:cytochrome o ubiquinol oxidase subunit IV